MLMVRRKSLGWSWSWGCVLMVRRKSLGWSWAVSAAREAADGAQRVLAGGGCQRCLGAAGWAAARQRERAQWRLPATAVLQHRLLMVRRECI